jgi:uncharacterized membrane protein
MVTPDSIRSTENAAREVWAARSSQSVNVGQTERLVSTVGGGVLLAAGLFRGGLKGLVAAGLGAALVYRGQTGHCCLYDAIGANTAEQGHGPADSVPAQAGVRIEESVTIGALPNTLYRFWRNYENLPKFMSSIESVTDLGGGRSHWVASGPLGVQLEWDAELHNDMPGEMLAWRSLDGSQVDVAGSVHFDEAPGGGATSVRVNQKVNPPGGRLGVAVAKLFGADPAAQLRANLLRFKQLVESGRLAQSAADAT